LVRCYRKGLRRNADGSLTLCAGVNSPGKGNESNSLPAPEDAFSLYIRAYWGGKMIVDGIWQPRAIRAVN
jgi:hypothetical protein